MILREITNEEFNLFINQFKHNCLYQSIEYKNVMKNEGFDTILVGLIDNEHIEAASLILIEKKGKIKYAYVPRGFIIDYNNLNLLSIFTKEIKKFLSKKNVISLKICPPVVKSITDFKYNITNDNNYFNNIFYSLTKLGYRHLGFNNYFEALKPRFEAIIDLNVPYYIIFKNIKKEYRTKIRSAEAKGIKVYKGNIENLDDLYVQIKKKYPRNLNYFKKMYNEFNINNNVDIFYTILDTKYYLNKIQIDYHKQENICTYYNYQISSNYNKEKFITKKMEADKLLNKYKKEIIIATKYLKEYPNGVITSTAIVIKNTNNAYLLMDGFDSKFKKFNSKHLLIWKMCEMYSKNNLKSFNLGGITNPTIENNKFEGLNYFKLNFNSLCYEYIGDFELICNDALYYLYKGIPLKNILKI